MVSIPFPLECEVGGCYIQHMMARLTSIVAQMIMGEISRGISGELGSNLDDSIKTPIEATQTLQAMIGKSKIMSKGTLEYHSQDSEHEDTNHRNFLPQPQTEILHLNDRQRKDQDIDD